MVRTAERDRSGLGSVLSREVEERGVLAEIGRVIGSSLHINEVYEKFGEQVRRLLPWDRITVVTVDTGSATERIAYVAGLDLPGLVPGTIEPFEGNPVGDSVTRRTGLVLNRQLMQRYSLLVPNLAGGLNSMLCVALIWRDQPIGALVLQATRDNAYSARDLALTERVGAQIAGAIANAQLHDEVSQHAHERAVVAEIGRIVASFLHVADVHTEFSEHVRRLLPFNSLEITTVDSDRGTVRRHYASGASLGVRHDEVEQPLAGTVTERVIKNRSGLVLSGSEAGVAARAPSGSRSTGWRSVMAVPLIARNEAIGALCLYSVQAAAYSSDSLALAQMIAEQIAGSIANAELHADLLRTADERAFVAELWRLARPGIEVADLCEAVAARLKPVLPYDRMVIDLAAPPDGPRFDSFVAGPKDGPDVAANGTHQVGALTRRVMLAGRGLILGPDPRQPAGADPKGTADGLPAGVLSGVSTPLSSGDDVIGALHIQCFRASAYSGRQLKVAERLGEQIGRAMTLTGAFAGAAPQNSEQSFAPHTERDHSWAWKVDSSGAPGGRTSTRDVGGRVSLLIVDRLSICRRGYAALFRNTGIEVIGDVADMEQAAEQLAKYKPRLLLFEPHVGEPDAFRQLESLPLAIHGTKVLVVAESASAEDLRSALRSGAHGFMLKTVSPVGLVNAVERVATGGTVIEPDLLSGLVDDLAAVWGAPDKARGELMEKLSRRDISILGALVRGQSNTQIAAALHLSPGTVRNRLMGIYRVLGVSDRASAAHVATRAGIV